MATPSELRALFETTIKKRITSATPSGDFLPIDLERVKDDQYLLRVLKHCKNDLEKSSKLLWNIMKWRKVVGASEICENNVRMDYVLEGIIFPHGRDVGGCRLVILKVKSHVKGLKDFEEVKRVIIYWLDRIEREETGKEITLFFDMEGCGLQNVDIELIKYLVTLLTYYYPSFLNQVIVYQLPWILTAAFKVVKSLLPPEAVNLLKFVNKNNLKEVVHPDQALVAWGGTNDYIFKFLPERSPKKVTFQSTLSLNTIEATDCTTYVKDPTIPMTDSTISTEDATISAADYTFPNDAISDEMIHIEPRRELVFKNENDVLTAHILITNLVEKMVAFKIRTTSPEKFCVRPTSGLLQKRQINGNKERIQIVDITVLPGFHRSVNKEKFLVMVAEVNSKINRKELKEIWNDLNKVEEYRLKCHIVENVEHSNVKNSDEAKTVESVNRNKVIEENNEIMLKLIQDMRKDINVLILDISQLKTFNIVSLIFIFILGFLSCMMFRE